VRSPRVRTLALAVSLFCLLGVERPLGLGDVAEVRHWSYPDYTRVVVEFTRPVESSVKYLPADPAAGRPERLYLDVPGIWVGRRFVDGVSVGDGLLRAVRLGQNTLTTTRVVIDVEQYDRHRLLTLSHPDRLVVDVYGRRQGAERLRWPERRQREGSAPGRLPADLRSVRTVVLDPGHGGRDPGAIGVGGLREKEVTLRLAKLVAKELRTKGFRVILTREKDRTMSLEERTAIAEGSMGDLFVSLHINASPRRSVSGIETYYLDENHERHTLDLAARENGVKLSEVNALQRTLAKLYMEEMSPYSRHLATLVQERIVKGMPRRYRPVQDLGVKKGPFYVLFLSNMPAILLEAGFITNRKEAKRLRDGGYLEGMAEQIAIGLSRYRGGDPGAAARWAPDRSATGKPRPPPLKAARLGEDGGAG
jgi:N-acetylmuramoyl-L-alanine amidase